MAERRLMKELSNICNKPPPGLHVEYERVHPNLFQWVVDLEGAENTLYQGEKFQLMFKFTSKYPFDSPQVMFVGSNIPIHPHIYSNGHICLSILTTDWSPALTVESVCISIISMLSSCKDKKPPPDNDMYVRKAVSNPKHTNWWYHDDDV